MANNRIVTSRGDPYFAFSTGDMGDRNTLPGGGATDLFARFRVNALPKQLASADELHPIIAFVHDTPTQPTMLALGVTPNGRIKATNSAGDVFQTPAGIILDASRWYEVTANYDYLVPGWTVTVDGSVGNSAGTVVVPVLPNPGYNTRVLLFNGKDGISRTNVSVSRTSIGFQGTDLNVYEWDLHEHEGPTLTPLKYRLTGTGTFEMAETGVATAVYYDPLITAPWGTVPTIPPASSYRWSLETDYTRQARPVTYYTRVSQ